MLQILSRDKRLKGFSRDGSLSPSLYYWGYSTDTEMRINASSGGVVSELLCYMVSNKIVDYVTCVTTRTGERSSGQIITNSLDVIRSCRTSKYCPVLWNDIVGKIEHLNGTVAIVGLPCQVNSLKKYFSQRKSNGKVKYYLSLFCNHTPSLNAAEYVAKGYAKNAILKRVVNRGGGFPGFMKYEINENGKNVCFQTPYRKTWHAGYGKYFKNMRCMLCNDPFAQNADVSFGDSYFLQETDTLGTTFCIVRNKEIANILTDMCRNGLIFLNEGPDKSTIHKAYKVLFDKEREFIQKNKCLRLLGRRTVVPVSLSDLDLCYAGHFYKGMLTAQLGRYKLLWPYLLKKNKLKNLITNIEKE